MRIHFVLAIVLLASAAQAKEKHYQSGKLLRMDSEPCGMDQKNGKSLTGEILGTDSAHMKTRELLCQEYVLETEKVIYKMVLRVEDMDDKDREYMVVSMTPNTSSTSEGLSIANGR